jgi:hypothetical protein
LLDGRDILVRLSQQEESHGPQRATQGLVRDVGPEIRLPSVAPESLGLNRERQALAVMQLHGTNHPAEQDRSQQITKVCQGGSASLPKAVEVTNLELNQAILSGEHPVRLLLTDGVTGTLPETQSLGRDRKSHCLSADDGGKLSPGHNLAE